MTERNDIDMGTFSDSVEKPESSQGEQKNKGGRPKNPLPPTTEAEVKVLISAEIVKAKPNAARLDTLWKMKSDFHVEEAAAKVKAEADAKLAAAAEAAKRTEFARLDTVIEAQKAKIAELQPKADERDAALTKEAAALKTAKDAVEKMNVAVTERDKAVEKEKAAEDATKKIYLILRSGFQTTLRAMNEQYVQLRSFYGNVLRSQEITQQIQLMHHELREKFNELKKELNLPDVLGPVKTITPPTEFPPEALEPVPPSIKSRLSPADQRAEATKADYLLRNPMLSDAVGNPNMELQRERYVPPARPVVESAPRLNMGSVAEGAWSEWTDPNWRPDWK